MDGNSLDLSGTVITKEHLLGTLKALKKQLEEKGLPPTIEPAMFAPPEVWAARQRAIDAGDFERAAYIEMIIARANGY